MQEPTAPTREPDLAKRIATITREHPHVTQLHGGTFGDIAVPLPGPRITGVRISNDRIEIGVVLDWDAPLADVAAELRASVMDALRAHGDPVRPVDITIAEIEDDVSETAGTEPDVAAADATSAQSEQNSIPDPNQTRGGAS